MVLIDIILSYGVYDISNIDDFLVIIGFITFASVSCNLLYNYISKRFGYKPIIIYRLITSLYLYIIPIIPDMYILFQSVARMIYPYIMYLIIEYAYSKKSKINDYKGRKKEL